jgi:hypothetical protein
MARLALALVTVLALVVGAVRAGGEPQAASVSALFTNPDGSPCKRPCLLGVRPGETTLEAAYNLLKSHPLTRDFGDWSQRTGSTVARIRLNTVLTVLQDHDGIVSVISLRFDGGADSRLADISLGDVINVLGPPGFLQPSGQNERVLRLYYPSERMVLISQVNERGDGKQLSATAPLMYLSLCAPDWFFSVWRSPMLSAIRWHGFTSAQRYTGVGRWMP